MQIGLMNHPALPLPEQINAMGQAGYDFLDLTIEGPCALNPDVDKVRKLLDKYKLNVVGHTDPCLPYAYPIDEVRNACYKELERCARIFQALGAAVMNIHPCYTAPPGAKSARVKAHVEVLKPLSQMAKSHGLKLVLENFSAPFDTVETFSLLLDEIPDLGLHLDVGHTHFGADDALGFFKKLGHKIDHVHFSDNRGNADHHMPLGVGGVDWKSVIEALKRTGYDQTITLEVFCQDQDMFWKYADLSRQLVRSLWDAA
ncbi:MAG: sugar phosphate isomerase/epimerase [Desulfatibacillum sp.]|nr:sugar phosphate isomerase/epimerase [Desulfatibacillum sp.]